MKTYVIFLFYQNLAMFVCHFWHNFGLGTICAAPQTAGQINFNLIGWFEANLIG